MTETREGGLEVDPGAITAEAARRALEGYQEKIETAVERAEAIKEFQDKYTTALNQACQTLTALLAQLEYGSSEHVYAQYQAQLHALEIIAEDRGRVQNALDQALKEINELGNESAALAARLGDLPRPDKLTE